MFKKRGNPHKQSNHNNNNSINFEEMILGQVEQQNENNHKIMKNSKQNDIKKNIQNPVDHNQNDQDEQFLNKLKNDKKLQSLFDEIDEKQKQRQSQIKLNQTKLMFNTLLIKNQIKRNSINQVVTQNCVDKQVKQNIYEKQTIDNVFKQILQNNKKDIKKQSQNYQNNYFHSQNHHTKHNQIIIEDNDDDYIQSGILPKQKFSIPHQPEPINLDVEVDYGHIQPKFTDKIQSSDQNEYHHEQDYEDQLIRKTLTRANYSKILINNNLKQAKQTQKNTKLLSRILKTSWEEIQYKLNKDISGKTLKKNQIQKEVVYLNQRIKEHQNQHERKKKMLQNLKNEYQKVLKVIYCLCYFGDQIDNVQTFFNDLTSNILIKMQQLSNQLNIQEFMTKQHNKQQLKQKLRSIKKGRKKIKTNNQDQNKIDEENMEDDDDDQDDGHFVMDDDDF